MTAPTRGTAAATALADFILLNEEIAALVRARLPLESHLAQLGRELPGKAGALAEGIGRRMESGETLAAAMEAECASLPAVYRAAVIAGVQSGQLSAALESLTETASRMDELRRITGVALLYPLVILVVACGLLAVIVRRVVPNFAWLNERHFGPLTWLTDQPAALLVLAIGVPCAVVLATMIWWWRSGRVGGAGWRHRLSTWLPGTRGVRHWSEAANFAELLRLFVERGLPLDQSLRLAAGATEDRPLRSAAERLADEIGRGAAVERAGTVGDSSRQPGFPPLVRLALHHARDRGLLVGGLRQAASMYRERAIRGAEWHAEYFPILLTVVLGGTLTIGFTLTVLWPYASTLHELADWKWK